MAAPYLIMFAAGIGIPMLAALNAGLGKAIGSPAIAASVLFIVAFLIALVTASITGFGPLEKLSTAPRHLFFGGVFVAFYVLAVTWIAPQIGVGNAVFLVLLGQLVSAALIDHFGLFGASVTHLTAARASGIAIMAAGLFVAFRL